MSKTSVAILAQESQCENSLGRLHNSLKSMPGQDERRAAVDARFGAVEADVAWACDQVAGAKRNADQMLKSTKLILEGFTQCETLFQARMGGQDKDWRKLKEDWPAAMGRDMTAHLGEGDRL